MSAPDVVYVVKPGEDNEPLRHSLRSLANLAHGPVWMVGYRPRWVDESVGYVPTVQRGQKHQNTARNWQAMADAPELPERFVLMNDDFFIMREIGAVPTYHRGSLDAMIDWYHERRLATWRSRAVSTRALLRLFVPEGELYSYELHVPMVIERPKLAAALADLHSRRRSPVEHYSKRTWYGNHARVGGWQAGDVKAMGAKAGMPDTALPFLSTSTQSWGGPVGGTVRRIFADRSPYEREPTSGLYRPPAPTSRRLTRAAG